MKKKGIGWMMSVFIGLIIALVLAYLVSKVYFGAAPAVEEKVCGASSGGISQLFEIMKITSSAKAC